MDKEYDIGFKKPPKHKQFQPGQSGNPKGRPKGTKNLRTDLEEELQTKITITEGGQPLKLSKQRALLKSLFARAIKGDARATNTLINLILKVQPEESLQASEEQEKSLKFTHENYKSEEIKALIRIADELARLFTADEIDELIEIRNSESLETSKDPKKRVH